MRRRPAVGVVLCNRMPSPLPHRSSYITLRLSETGPRRTRPYTHTLTFPVTTAYITHTCSTVQHRMHVTHVHVFFFLSFFPSSFYALYPLIYISRLSPLSLLHYPFTLVRFIICNLSSQRAFVVVDSYPWFDFASVILSFFFFCFLYNGRAHFFFFFSLLLSLLVSGLPPKQLKEKDGRSNGVYTTFSFHLAISTCALCLWAKVLKSPSFPLSLL